MGDDAEVTLIREVLSGRRECYRPLVEKYRRKVYVLAYSLVGDPSEAQDIAQDAFIKAYERLHTLKSPGKFGSWLFGITRNLCYEALRRRKVESESLEKLREVDRGNVIPMRPGGEVGVRLVDLLLSGLARLPEKYRVLLRMKYLEDYSYKEIAELLDLPVDLVRSRLFEGRRILREGIVHARSGNHGL